MNKLKALQIRSSDFWNKDRAYSMVLHYQHLLGIDLRWFHA